MLTCFVVTLALLALVVLTGLAARRRLHIALVVGAVAGLAATVYFAYELGEVYDLEAAGWITPVHMTMARVNTFCFALPIASGIRTLFVPSTRRLHRWLAFGVLGLTVLTAATGTWMLMLAPPFAS